MMTKKHLRRRYRTSEQEKQKIRHIQLGTKKYKDILRGRFKINKMVRIELEYNSNTSTSFKGGDITSKTIKTMIKEGESNALIELSH